MPLNQLWGKFSPTTGHKHTGAAGDGPKITASTGMVFTAPPTLAPGYQETGLCGLGYNAAGAGAYNGSVINFKTVMSNVPSGITLAADASGNVATTAVANISIYGFRLGITSTAAGDAYWVGRYVTVGN